MTETVSPELFPSRPFGQRSAFLAGTGEMARLIRECDWASTSVGPIESWPQSLRTVVRVLLNSHHRCTSSGEHVRRQRL